MNTRLLTLGLLGWALLGAVGCAPAPGLGAASPTPPVVTATEDPTSPAEPDPDVAGNAEPEPDGEQGEEEQDTILGDFVAEVPGSGGLGLSGLGQGGGGSGRLGGLGQGSGGHLGKAPPTIRTGAAAVVGILPKEIIRRVIRQHVGEVRHCYEVALKSARPDLAGKLVVRFTIGANGDVIGQQISAGLEPALDECVARVFARMKFPQPEGGGVVVVSYPLVFQSAADEPEQPDLGSTPPGP